MDIGSGYIALISEDEKMIFATSFGLARGLVNQTKLRSKDVKFFNIAVYCLDNKQSLSIFKSEILNIIVG